MWIENLVFFWKHHLIPFCRVQFVLQAWVCVWKHHWLDLHVSEQFKSGFNLHVKYTSLSFIIVILVITYSPPSDSIFLKMWHLKWQNNEILISLVESVWSEFLSGVNESSLCVCVCVCGIFSWTQSTVWQRLVGLLSVTAPVWSVIWVWALGVKYSTVQIHPTIVPLSNYETLLTSRVL